MLLLLKQTLLLLSQFIKAGFFSMVSRMVLALDENQRFMMCIVKKKTQICLNDILSNIRIF